MNKGTVDWEWVQRAVAQSQPPRLADLPMHIKFAKKWGGGDNQMFVRELVEYLKLKMPTGRIVSGHFLKTCASVNLPPNVCYVCMS